MLPPQFFPDLQTEFLLFPDSLLLLFREGHSFGIAGLWRQRDILFRGHYGKF
jgi:hypothetical protein